MVIVRIVPVIGQDDFALQTKAGNMAIRSTKESLDISGIFPVNVELDNRSMPSDVLPRLNVLFDPALSGVFAFGKRAGRNNLVDSFLDVFGYDAMMI